MANPLPVKTNHDYPPIPIRDFDWSAWIDGVEGDGPTGRGPSEYDAIIDLAQVYFADVEQGAVDALIGALKHICEGAPAHIREGYITAISDIDGMLNDCVQQPKT